MNPLACRIKADTKIKRAHLPEGKDADLANTYWLLFTNRGRTLFDAAKDAEEFYVDNFMLRVERLFDLGWVEAYDDVIYLPRKPRGPLERLAFCAT